MSFNLVIVESPNKCKPIQGYLQALYPREKWEVAASVGHFTELSKRSGDGYVCAGVLASTYLPDNVVSESKASIFRKLKALVKDAKKVYLATDDDREGEAIAEQLETWLRLKNPVRVLFKEITKAGVQAGMDNPAGRINHQLVTAQKARRVLDRLVGFMVSPDLARVLNARGSSAGRVQSPVLGLIDDRKQEIMNFKANDFFDVFLTGQSEGKEFKAKLHTKPFQNEHGYFIDTELANSFAEVRNPTLANYEEKERLRQPPSALTTSLMQQAASAALKMRPNIAMEAAQALFEAGLITYHRTDNPNISPETYEQIKADFYDLGVMPTMREFKTGDDAQEAHPAITPTDLKLEQAGANDAQRAIYEMIRLYAIGSQLLPAKYLQRKALLTAEKDGHELNFLASGSELVEPGYLTFIKKYDVKEEGEEKEEESALLPNLQNGFEITAGIVEAKKTKPPALYTIKTLLKKLAQLGIGRPATLDGIFQTLETRKYIIINQKNQLTSTEHGEKILKYLVGQFSFIEYDFTSEIEKVLDLLASGEADYYKVMQGFHTKLAYELGELKKLPSEAGGFACPECEHPLNKITMPSSTFWGCSNRDNCKFTADDVDGKPVPRPKPKLSDHICPECNEKLINRVKTGPGAYDFWSCSGFPKCNYSADNVNGQPVERERKPDSGFKCRAEGCDKPLVRRTKEASAGVKGYDFWGCTGFRSGCKQTYQVTADGEPDYK